ncbi:DUF2301 domain-containing membrane protein [Microcoleus sp. FACHB-1515]|uniref:DUF2301 domain-containing membrane protein n=1 Tax=Cyanophyceae TaxID=3028117 RepID=UPI00168692DB|nr:DUF2301 domain-containing membrane protein [Microcoleus sp. FACHB-1515]MBD2093135.1 DUF2301 domain-containing membrane protein [Microcoleus sp. FACHB-1515]
MTNAEPTIEIYQGQFGEFTITPSDRQGVIVYRLSLFVAAVCFAIGSGFVLWKGAAIAPLLTPLFTVFAIALGISLLTIHIYMAALHRTLQAFWLIGSLAALGVAHLYPEPFAVSVYAHPQTIWGVGFMFAALSGIFFKEAFCFDRLETKLLTPIVPLLLLGHLFGVLSIDWERILLIVWSIAFLIFAVRKLIQAIPPDIGDKSVFAYLKQARS